MRYIRNLKIEILILSLTLTINVNAQLKDDFIKGTIVLQNNQKLEGWIKNDVISDMNYKINFKQTEDNKKIYTYDASEISSVILENGELYELIHYKGHYNSDSLSALGKLILRGKASLYKISYDSDDIFIVKINGKCYTLQNDKVEPGTMSTEVTSYFYKDYLTKALSAVPSTFERIQNSNFSDQNLINIISYYNKSLNAENTLLKSQNKSAHFIIAGFGGMVKNSTNNEIYLQAFYRSYLSRISKSTSFNIGLSYYYNRYSFNPYPGYIYSTDSKYKRTLISIPLKLQQNFLNKFIRPYIATGFNVCYLKYVNEKGVSQIEKGLQNNFGVGILYSAGIEADIYKGLMLKGEYLNEIFSHMIMFGVAYNFSKK